jgi:sigma-B regulation protein RsbU (phosphoserine phosphatase)
MSFRETSLVWRLSAFIIGGAGLVLLAVLVFNHVAQRRLIVEMQRAQNDTLTLAAVNHIEIQLNRVETAVHSAAVAWTLLPGDRTSTLALIEQSLLAHPRLFGMAVALAPEPGQTRGYRILYGFRDQGTVRVGDREKPDADYLEDWYYLPSQLQRRIWSEPYYDEEAKTAMVTFSVPVLREGRVVAVITGDLSLAWLRELLDSFPQSKGDAAVLLSGQGVFISHPHREFEMRETVFSLADSLPTKEATAELKALGRAMLGKEPGQRFYLRPVERNRALINHRRVSSIGWAIGVIVPEEEIMAALTAQTRTNLLVGGAGLLLLCLAAISVSVSLTAPLQRLAEAARQLAGGKFDIPLPPVRRRDEVGRLNESFDRMRTDLRDYIDRLTATTAAKEKVASELLIARQIQLGIVPKLFPAFPARKGLDLYACLEPAREVGGDLYDFALLDDDHLYIAIGDVSGKGVPASLFMAVGKTLLKSTIQSVRDPARALALVNDELAENNDSCMFITAFCGVLNLQTGDLTFANAGQNPPLIVHPDGAVEMLQSQPGAPLAAMPGVQYSSHSLRLGARDLLLLYTDGVTEAMNPANEMFDEPQLIALAGREHALATRPLIEKIVAAVHLHATGAEQSDDITVLALRLADFPGVRSAGPQRAPDAHLALRNHNDELPRLVGWIETLGEQHAWSPALVLNLNLALEEWFANVLSYAFADAHEHTLHFRLWHEGKLLRIEIEDDGRPFDPTAQATPNTDGTLEQRKIGGLGIHFIRRVMASMSYRRQDGRNLLTLTVAVDVPPSSVAEVEH